MRVGIVGMGAVGNGIHKMFPAAATFDEPKGVGTRGEINACDVVFVCVPTPQNSDGSCDTSVVESVIAWIEAPVIVLRSTVSVGTTRQLHQKYGKAIVFQPEYGPAETPDHPFNDLRRVRWIILGGERAECKKAARAWMDAYNSDITIMYTSAETAELCKYMENAFLAMKVAFCNEFFELARVFGVDYDELREAWLLDPRIGRSHTFVFADKRGYGGRCLPKDMSAIVSVAQQNGYEPALLREVIASNERFRDRNRGEKPR